MGGKIIKVTRRSDVYKSLSRESFLVRNKSAPHRLTDTGSPRREFLRCAAKSLKKLGKMDPVLRRRGSLTMVAAVE